MAASIPEMFDAQSRLNAMLTAVDPVIDDATAAARIVEQLGNVIAGGNLMTSNMAAALSANSSDTLEAIEKDFKETVQKVKSSVEMLPKGAGGKTMGDAVAKLQALGEGKERIFKIRQKELDAADYGETILEETRKLNVGLGISVQQLVDGVRKETDTATAQAREEISLATIVMLALGVATLVGSVLFVWLYVGRSILRRIRALQSSMKLLSSGDLDSEIYRSAQNDEIAEMSESLQVFRESMIAARAMTADQDKDRVAKAERASRMEARIVEFETTVRGALDSLQSIGQFDAVHRAEHVDLRRPVERAGQRGRLRRRRDLGQRADRLRPAPRNCRRRSPRSAARWWVRPRSPARRSRKPAPPTPPCRVWPTTPRASASWST